MDPAFSLAAVAVILVAVLFLARRAELRARSRLAALECYRRDLLHLVDVSRRLSRGEWRSGPEMLLQEIVHLGYAAAAAFYSMDESGGLAIRAAAGPAGAPASPDPEGVERVLARKEPVPVAGGAGMLLPVQEAGELLGVLACTGLPRRDGAEAQLALTTFLEGVAELAALVFATHSAFKQQAALSATDGLTGLYNHRHFQQLLGVSLAQSYLEGAPFSLIIFDIDHFKHINDSRGHLFGDLVLREVANVTRRVVPSQAIVARYGGEEFAVALPGVDTAAAAALAEKLRSVLAAHQILDYTSGAQTAVTVSLGVASYTLGQGKNRLIARADEALYASKHAGRNRVTVADGDE